jgi:phosphoribosylformylglycinamidine cyclo-ligase
MRARRELRYLMHGVPPVPPLFAFMTREAGLDAAEAYATFNMGAGFAVYVPDADARRAVDVAARCGLESWIAGRVESGAREVVIEPLSIRYAGETLALRS